MFLQLNCSFPVSGGAYVVARGVACMVRGRHVWVLGGMHGCSGVCMVAGGHAWLPGSLHGCRGHAWLPGGVHGCSGGHMHGCQGACMVARGHAWLPGGMCGCQGGCIPCDLSHHAFDVTCMLSLLQLRLNRNAAAYIVLVM